MRSKSIFDTISYIKFIAVQYIFLRLTGMISMNKLIIIEYLKYSVHNHEIFNLLKLFSFDHSNNNNNNMRELRRSN